MHPCRAPLRHLPEQIAFALWDARQTRGWSLREAARQTGVSYPYLHHLERGRRVPSRAVADVLVAAYHLDTADPAATAELLALAVPDRGRSSPYHRQVFPSRQHQAMGDAL